MQYDPIKRSLGSVFNRTPFLRKVFYRLLDLLLLRAWHIHKELGAWKKNRTGNAALNGNNTPALSILDAGAGFGQYTYYLSTLNPNWRITAVDIKPEQIRDCNTFFQRIDKKNVRFEEADLTQFKREDSYDLILSVDVMEHILDDVSVFKNFYTSLKPNGVLLVSTPSDQGGSDAHDDDHEHEPDEHGFIDEHVRDGYGVKEIEEKLRAAGFSGVEARYTYGAPGKLSWKLSMKYPIQLLGISKLFFIVLPLYYALIYPVAFTLNWIDTASMHASGTGLMVKAWK